jgi:hypothetical protein
MLCDFGRNRIIALYQLKVRSTAYVACWHFSGIRLERAEGA